MDTTEQYKKSIVNPLEPMNKIERAKWYEDPVYIKMCEEAEEIQGKYWVPLQGDFCCLKGAGSDAIVNGWGYAICILHAVHASRDEMNQEWAENNQYLVAQTVNFGFNKEELASPKQYTFINYGFDKHQYTWLPRQDQLQAMYSDGIFALMSGFGDWFYKQKGYKTVWQGEKPELVFTSMEQLWLAFVIKELYQKTWNGNTWVS